MTREQMIDAAVRAVMGKHTLPAKQWLMWLELGDLCVIGGFVPFVKLEFMHAMAAREKNMGLGTGGLYSHGRMPWGGNTAISTEPGAKL